jgi:hypothetical protein
MINYAIMIESYSDIVFRAFRILEGNKMMPEKSAIEFV